MVENTAEKKGDGLFEHSIFAIVINRDLSKTQALELQKTLEDHAGKVVDFEGGINVEEVTHIISATSDFPEYADARLHMIPVITPAWVTDSLIRNKEAQIRPFTPDPNLIFANISLTCANIPTGDKDAIIGAVLAMGGQETSSLVKLTTHICALSMDHPKCEGAVAKGHKAKIVLPHWFDDCLKLGKRIDERPYLLPDPEILRMKPEDPLVLPKNEEIVGATSPRPNALPVPTDSPTRRLTVFKGKKVMIDEDLQISARLRAVIEDLIRGGEGDITNTVHSADIFVCHWREGRNYTFASRAGIDVGNLSWLYHMIVHNEWTSPLRRLLHYPLPRDGIPGFKDLRITLSNYGGEARTYLENLIVACGGEFTKSMKPDNTHLITARKTSEKCVAAEEWKVEMINHLWIEESYAKCQVQRLTDPRYTHFPPRTNLGEIIGRTEFDRNILAQLYFPKDPTPSPDDSKPLKRSIMHERDKNVSTSRKTSRSTNVEMGSEDGTIQTLTPAKKPRAKSRQSVGAVTTPASNRRISTGKENDTPSSTGSRSAKNKANSLISVQAPDMLLYEKEKKRKGHVFGGERAANRLEKELSTERSSSPAKKHEDEEVEEEYSEDEGRVRKRQKTSAQPPIKIRLMLTGYKGWLGNPNKEDSEKKKLRDLGILVTQDPKTCTHLAAPNVVRTKKFLCSLASGPEVLSSDFVETCIKQGKLPKVEDFLLKDPENEKKFGVKLKDVVIRAKANRRCLLRQVPIYCTEGIANGSTTYKEIVEANGGTISLYTGRPVVKKIDPKEDDGPAEPVYLITGHTPKEKALWPKFEQMAKEGNMIPRVVVAEWLLEVAMAQHHKWNMKYLAVNNKPITGA